MRFNCMVRTALPFEGDGGDRVRIVIAPSGVSTLGLWVAHDASFFAKERLDDHMILIPSGTQPAQVVTAGTRSLDNLEKSRLLKELYR